MQEYTGFANIYDMFMDNVPYDEWTTYLVSLLHSYGINEGIVAELGCGTGNVTRRLKENGYDMIGIDNSPDMLDKAMEKQEDESILYLLQDIRELDLYGTIQAAVSICDSMNYITDDEDIIDVFNCVNLFLENDGIFIFDLNLSHYYEKIKDTVITENREEASFIWENSYDDETHINEYDMTFFVKQKDDIYEKFCETHIQRGYGLKEIIELINKSDLLYVDSFEAFTQNKADEMNDRIYIVTKKGTRNE